MTPEKPKIGLPKAKNVRVSLKMPNLNICQSDSRIGPLGKGPNLWVHGCGEVCFLDEGLFGEKRNVAVS